MCVQNDITMLADVFTNFRNLVLEIYHLELAWLLTTPGLVWQAALEKATVKFDLLTDINMLLIREKGMRGEASHAVHWYTKADNKNMQNYYKNKKPSSLKYWNVHNLDGWAMYKKFLVNDLKWVTDISEFNENVIEGYNDESDEQCFLEVDVQYPGNFHNLHNNLPFLPEKMEIKKVGKLEANLHDKGEYVIYKRNLKKALNHELVLKKVHKIIKFNQEAWLKPYIDMNSELRKKAKNNFKKDSFKLMINAVFAKTMEIMRKYRDIKLLNKLSCNKIFVWQFISNKNEKNVKHIQQVSKIVMYEFFYDYVKLKYWQKTKLCYMHTDSFLVYIKTDEFYKDITVDIKNKVSYFELLIRKTIG